MTGGTRAAGRRRRASWLRPGPGTRRLLPALCLLLVGLPAAAHESAYSYLRLRLDGAELAGEWEIHLRDAAATLGLAAETGEAPDLAGRGKALAALLRRTLAIGSDGGACPTEVEKDFTRTPGRDYALLRFRARCPAAPVQRLHLEYGVLFDADAEHRGFFAVDDGARTHVGVFTADERAVRVDVRRAGRWQQVADALREGVRHIGLGTDHVLFLVALLLPAPLRRNAGRWEARPGFAGTAREVVGVVTAFTLAHSLTLAAAVLGPPLPIGARWIEVLIAVSVFAAAWNNVRPFATQRPWAMAFGFGLVHGLGFAGALAELGLPRMSRGPTLVGFNLGVEAGQLAVVAVLLPAIFAARHTRAYRGLVLPGASLVIAWVAVVWALERLLGIELLGFL